MSLTFSISIILGKTVFARVKLQIKQAEYLVSVGCKGQELISVSISSASSVSTLTNQHSTTVQLSKHTPHLE